MVERQSWPPVIGCPLLLVAAGREGVFAPWELPCFEQDETIIVKPREATMPNGRTAAREEVIAAANNVKAYVAESDKYQECIKGVIEGMDQAQKQAEDQAKADKKPLATRVRADYAKSRADLIKKGEANQTAKEKLGAAYAATAAAYRAAHPTPAAAR